MMNEYPADAVASPYEDILNDLAERGWSISTSFVTAEQARALADEAEGLWADDGFRLACVGTGAEWTLRPEVRTDRVAWIDASALSPATAAYWKAIERLRVELNQAFYLGLHDFEGHFAVYPAGSFYRRHLDRFKRTSRRTVTCILYLNEDWTADDAGFLRIYSGGTEDSVDVWPERGTFVCFRSDVIYHEVLPTRRERLSLTGWLRREG